MIPDFDHEVSPSNAPIGLAPSAERTPAELGREPRATTAYGMRSWGRRRGQFVGLDLVAMPTAEQTRHGLVADLAEEVLDIDAADGMFDGAAAAPKVIAEAAVARIGSSRSLMRKDAA
jgi:hypothetical protein